MKNYVPITLDQYINESKSITLKRGYKGQSPVVVGATAPIRNQVLSFVSESKRVGAADLKRFIAGLNEANENPNAAANMWLRRNGKYFVTESKAGRTFYKLSTLGQRLVNSFAPPTSVNEQKKQKPGLNLVSKLLEMVEEHPELEPEAVEAIDGYREQYPDFDEELGEVEGKDKYVPMLKQLILDLGGSLTDEEEVEELEAEEMEEVPEDEMEDEMEDEIEEVEEGGIYEKKKYDFKDPKTDKPGITDDEDEDVDEGCMKEGISSERKARIEAIIENIKSRKAKALNEEEEEKEDDSSDELSFDDLDLEGEEGEGADHDEKTETPEEEEAESEETQEKEKEEGTEEHDVDGDEEKVEITEFILTVDDVDSAIEELSELDIEASKVVDPDAEPEEGEEEAYKSDEISVKAEDWDSLKGWLEDKGVDVEEMFGGEIEVEDIEDEDEEGEEDLDLDIDLEDTEEGEGEDDLDLDVDLDLEDGEGSEDLEMEEEEPEVEESLTGMEKHVDDTNNLIKGAKTVIIKYDR